MKWTAWATLFLGSWVAFSPFALNYRGALLISDVATGAFVFLLSIWELLLPRTWKRWALSVAGIWLLFAPLVFWAQEAGLNHCALKRTGCDSA